MIPLRQNTDNQVQKIGPFVGMTDGVAYTTALASTDIHLWKHGGTSTNKNSGGSASLGGGLHEITFDATDTDTAGRLSLSVGAISLTALIPYDLDFLVLPASIYDEYIFETQKKTG